MTIVPTGSADGVAFGQAVSDIAAERGYEVTVLSAPQKLDVWRAAWGTGAVVFDATIEPSGAHNYAVADYVLLMSRFNIVVSRSYLPVNFRGHLHTIAPPYPDRWSNEQLLEAVKGRLESIASELPRQPQTVQRFEEEFSLAHEALTHEQSETFDVFLSYRGTHADAAQVLAADASRQYGKRVQIIRTDDLSYSDEVLSMQRRWQVLRRIYELLLPAHEVWVMWSDDYLDSWWTQGELVAFAYMSDDARRASLRIHATGNGAPPSPERLVPRLNRRQDKSILKRFVLSSLPESLQRVRAFANKPLARILLGVADDPMLSPSFSRDPMLECVVCRQRLPSSHTLDVDEFLDGGLTRLRAISVDAWERSRVSGELQCPDCRSRYRIAGGPSRYWWYPVRSHGPTGPGRTVLEERPLCRAVFESER